MPNTTPFDDLRADMERRRITACAHDLHIFKRGTRWGVCIVPDTGDVFGAPCNNFSMDDQPGDTLGADWRDHWRRRHDTAPKQPQGDDQ